MSLEWTTEVVPIDRLTPHPRNYRRHPRDQIAHLEQSLKENGFYRNIVCAQDYTILAGHGVWLAAKALGLTEIPVRVLDLDPMEPRALKVLAADNELGNLAEIDDRALSEILKEVRDQDLSGLFGTGYDDLMLANLAFVTRDQSEIADFDEAAEWVGMPEYDTGPEAIRVSVSFRNEQDRLEFARVLGLRFTEKTKSTWWPPKAADDVSSVRFEAEVP